jgi:hypothetical protein
MTVVQVSVFQKLEEHQIAQNGDITGHAHNSSWDWYGPARLDEALAS